MKLFGKSFTLFKGKQLDLFNKKQPGLFDAGSEKEFAPGDKRRLEVTSSGKLRWKNADEKNEEPKLVSKKNKDDEFKEWYGESFLVDENGKPKIMYHGSSKTIKHFEKNKIGTGTDAGWLGEGFYFYDNEIDAAQYGTPQEFYLKIENPYFATDEENERLAELNDPIASREFTKRLKKEGYDGVYYNGNLRGETVVFESKQIRPVNDSKVEKQKSESAGTLIEDIPGSKVINPSKAYDILKDYLGAKLEIVDKSGKLIEEGIFQLMNENGDKTYSIFYQGKEGDFISFKKDQLVTQDKDTIEVHFRDKNFRISLEDKNQNTEVKPEEPKKNESKPKESISGNVIQDELEKELENIELAIQSAELVPEKMYAGVTLEQLQKDKQLLSEKPLEYFGEMTIRMWNEYKRTTDNNAKILYDVYKKIRDDIFTQKAADYNKK